MADPIEVAQIELVDITDSAPAILTLSASQPKVQIETDGNYSPNYKNNPQIITPTLYIGNTNVTNSIKDISYGDSIGNLDGLNLEISNNLTNSVVITATIKDFTYNNINYGTLTAQIELTKLSSTSNQYTAFITSGGRSIFTPTDRSSIILTANLFLGATEIKSGTTYKWFKNGAEILNKNNKTYKVTVDDINSMSNYHCEITLLGGNTYPTSSITIMDKTDPYSAQIISSSGLIFTSNTESTTLTCKVYQSNVEITNNITYKWYKISTNGRTEVPNETKSVSITADLSEQSVTYYCEATINGTTTALAQISLMTAPKFNTVISPKQIFLPFKGEVYQGGDSYILTFYLTAANGSKIDPTKYSINSIKFGTESSKYFEADISNEPIKISRDVTKNISNFPDSEICSISYTYMGVTFEEEFYFVKNVSGVNGAEGEKGEDGNGIARIEISYSRSNDGVRPPNNWYPSIDKIPEKDLILQFLWEKRIIYSTELENNTNKILSEEYSVQKDGLEIEKIVEYYALGFYVDKTGFYVKKIIYDINSKPVSIILENGEKQFFIFDSEGKLMIKDGNIIDENGYAVIESSSFFTVPFARLYTEKLQWKNSIPVSSEEANQEGDYNDVSLKEESTNLEFITVSENIKEEKSLWIKYQMIYKNGSYSETEPIPLEQINDLRLSAAQAETIYENDSIRSIVQKTNWGEDENGNPYTNLATYIEQLPNYILNKVVTNDKFETYFKMATDGLTIGKNKSHFTTFTDDYGFNIRYYPEAYDPTSTEIQDFKTMGTFDSSGLAVPQIILKNTFSNQSDNLNQIIILKGTSSGGMSFVKGTGRH